MLLFVATIISCNENEKLVKIKDTVETLKVCETFPPISERS